MNIISAIRSLAIMLAGPGLVPLALAQTPDVNAAAADFLPHHVAGHAFDESPSAVRARAWCPDNGDGTVTNPIFWGDWPDPDVIRVGDEFYFISTSMHYVPGCPIAKSKDLVNWEMAGYAVPRFDEDPRYDLKGGNRYCHGSWANTIRYHDGKFYVGFCTPGQGEGHFSMCTATNIDRKSVV